VGLMKPDLHFASEANVGNKRFLSKNPKSVCKIALSPAVSNRVAKNTVIENDWVASAKMAEPIKRESGSSRNSSCTFGFIVLLQRSVIVFDEKKIFALSLKAVVFLAFVLAFDIASPNRTCEKSYGIYFLDE